MKAQITSLLVLGLASVALAAPQSFDFKDAKGVNNVQFLLDAPLEPISGSASGISGTVTFDAANPGATKGKIVVDAASLTVPNSMMKDHMHGKDWVDVANNKEIVFDAKQLKNVKTTGDTTTADAVGTFTLKGVTKEVTVPVKLTYLKDKLAARSNGQAKGDLLVIRAKFSVQRTDYGINPKAPEDKVANSIDLTLSIVGAAPQK
jgi:polyisoprenoid-binding protein YceI